MRKLESFSCCSKPKRGQDVIGCSVQFRESDTWYLQTPHFPPSFAQCLQYLQFLQALHGSEPVQVAENSGVKLRRNAIRTIRARTEINLWFNKTDLLKFGIE